MSTNDLSRTLQVAYPATILLAFIATVGMRLVQAGGADLNHFFPNHKLDPFHRTIASTEVKACVNSDYLIKFFNHPQTLPDESEAPSGSEAGDVWKFVNSTTKNQGTTGFNLCFKK